MFEVIQSYFPVEWQRAVEFLGGPLWWIPTWQDTMLDFTLTGQSAAEIGLKRVFLLFPVLVVIMGVWVTMVSTYTLPFRAQRGRFVTGMAMSWWDAASSIWFFWAGALRAVVVIVGWLWALARLAVQLTVRLLQRVLTSPLVLLDWLTRGYFQPGVPWIALGLTLAWSALEATIFTYTLQPMLYEVLADITGFDPNRAVVTPILWVLLALLIAGSFACLHVLTEAIRERKIPQIVQMAFVELFVMFFEVMFLYRELIDAITPWIAQQTSGRLQLGLVSTLALAAFGWIGIRGMTWFLFARYGTGALVAVVSRETTMAQAARAPAPAAVPQAVWSDVLAAFKREAGWFTEQGQRVFELVSLPVLQLFAAAVNFVVVAVRSEPAFGLPFRSMRDVLAAAPRTGWPQRVKALPPTRDMVEPAKEGAR